MGGAPVFKARGYLAVGMVADPTTLDEILWSCLDVKPRDIDEALLCDAEVVVVPGFETFQKRAR